MYLLVVTWDAMIFFFDNSIVEGGGLNPGRLYWIELQSAWVLIPRMIFLGFQTTESNNPLTKLKVRSSSNFKGSFLKPIQPSTTLTWPRIIFRYQEKPRKYLCILWLQLYNVTKVLYQLMEAKFAMTSRAQFRFHRIFNQDTCTT